MAGCIIPGPLSRDHRLDQPDDANGLSGWTAPCELSAGGDAEGAEGPPGGALASAGASRELEEEPAADDAVKAMLGAQEYHEVGRAPRMLTWILYCSPQPCRVLGGSLGSC